MIDVIIPTFGRPHALAGIADNIRTVSPEATITFVVERHDPDSIAAVEALGLTPVINTRTANYAGALNSGWLASNAEWIFTGADDLIWHTGWEYPCYLAHDELGEVHGTNDLLNTHVLAGFHSTHSLVHREYLEEFGGVADEGPGSFYPECYDHNFCDTEFINTAKMRGRFRPHLDSVVEHLHVTTGKVEADDTYLRSVRNYDLDARMYDMRIPLWAGISR